MQVANSLDLCLDDEVREEMKSLTPTERKKVINFLSAVCKLLMQNLSFSIFCFRSIETHTLYTKFEQAISSLVGISDSWGCLMVHCDGSNIKINKTD